LCTGLFIPPSKVHPAELLVPQVENPTQATQDIVVQLRTICSPVLYAYLSRIADTAEKQRYPHVSCTEVDGKRTIFRDLDMFFENLHEFKVFDLSVFHSDDLRVLLLAFV